MERVPEPEIMDEREQAEAYAIADFAAVNQAFADAFAARFPSFLRGRIVDLGCGPADIPIRIAKRIPGVRITGVDGSEAMLTHGREAVRSAGLADRIDLVAGFIPGAVDGPFDAVVSNSLLHHLHRPEVLWSEIGRLARPGAAVFVVDLMRPASVDAARTIVETYSGNERPILKRDFLASLCAAFTPDEVRRQLDEAGLSHLEVRATTDRHLTIAGER
jgi:SAM-dependent methyltransferase